MIGQIATTLHVVDAGAKCTVAFNPSADAVEDRFRIEGIADGHGCNRCLQKKFGSHHSSSVFIRAPSLMGVTFHRWMKLNENPDYQMKITFARIERDEIKFDRHRAPTFCLSILFYLKHVFEHAFSGLHPSGLDPMGMLFRMMLNLARKL